MWCSRLGGAEVSVRKCHDVKDRSLIPIFALPVDSIRGGLKARNDPGALGLRGRALRSHFGEESEFEEENAAGCVEPPSSRARECRLMCCCVDSSHPNCREEGSECGLLSEKCINGEWHCKMSVIGDRDPTPRSVSWFVDII